MFQVCASQNDSDLPKSVKKTVDETAARLEELRRFLIQAKAEGMYELFLLELTTGMRRGELLALRWDDLDFATGALRIDKQICPVGGKLIVGEPKTRAANRAIILPPAAGRAPAASSRSRKTSGRGDTLPSGRTAKNTPGMSTDTQRRSARRS